MYSSQGIRLRAHSGNRTLHLLLTKEAPRCLGLMGIVDRPRLELGFPGCRPGALPLSYQPLCRSLPTRHTTLAGVAPFTPRKQWTDRDSNSDLRVANAAYSPCTISPWGRPRRISRLSQHKQPMLRPLLVAVRSPPTGTAEVQVPKDVLGELAPLAHGAPPFVRRRST